MHLLPGATLLVAVLALAGCAARAATPVAEGSVPDDGFVAELTEVEVAPPPAPSPAPDTTAVLADLGRRAAATAARDAAEPAHLSIPAIGVDTPTIDLDLTAHHAEVPESFHVAGWYRQTRTPGTVGPAVVVGHVGSKAGPGVFARLDQLRAGDQIHVTDEDGTTRTFVVDSGALVDKYDRPPEVFGWVGNRPELRLITCGGDFDPSTGHHVGNYVVWAHEVDT